MSKEQNNGVTTQENAIQKRYIRYVIRYDQNTPVIGVIDKEKENPFQNALTGLLPAARIFLDEGITYEELNSWKERNIVQFGKDFVPKSNKETS
jgi:hypothetical protein